MTIDKPESEAWSPDPKSESKVPNPNFLTETVTMITWATNQPTTNPTNNF